MDQERTAGASAEPDDDRTGQELREEIPGAPVPDLLEQVDGLELPDLPWRFAQSASALAQLSHHVLAIGPRAAGLLARLHGALAEEGIAALPSDRAHEPTRQRLGALGLEVLDHDPSAIGATLPFPPERFDLVIILDAAYDPVEVHRVLAPEGRLLAQQRGTGDLAELGGAASDPPEALEGLGDHLRRITEAGLEIESSDTFHGTGRVLTGAGLRALVEGEGLGAPGSAAPAPPLDVTLSRHVVQARRPGRPEPARTDFAEKLGDELPVPRV